ncbi:MAG: glycosyltransferase [Bacilli bacterium]
MKILVISSMANRHYNDRIVGGAERVVETMCQGLHDAEHDVTAFLYCNEKEMNRDYKTIVCSPYYADPDITPMRKRNNIADQLKRLCLRERYDVIINHSERYWSILFEIDDMFQTKETKPKIIHIEHSLSEFYKSMSRFRRFGKMVYAKTRGHEVHGTAAHFIEEWPKAMIGKHDIVLKYTANSQGSLITQEDIDSYQRQDGISQAAVATKETVLPSSGRGIFIGRASTMKNPLLAAEAYRELGIEADFFIASCEVNKNEQEIIDKLKKFDNIKLHLNESRVVLEQHLRRAKLIIVSGLDSFCLVAFEAANYGVPTIFAIKNNFVSKIPIAYDYQTEINNFIVDVNKKKKPDIWEEIREVYSRVPESIEQRQQIADELYASYNYEQYKKNLNEMIKNS